MPATTKPKTTPNYSAWRFVDKREPFQGSNLRGEAYAPGSALSSVGSWLSVYETEQYEKRREHITYVVWSFYTPIAYFMEGGPTPGWYKVGQRFSSYTGRHRSGALRNVPGHMVSLVARRGKNTVQCFDCGTTRNFTHKRDAEEVYWTHR